jgi:hypothetical protein
MAQWLAKPTVRSGKLRNVGPVRFDFVRVNTFEFQTKMIGNNKFDFVELLPIIIFEYQKFDHIGIKPDGLKVA